MISRGSQITNIRNNTIHVVDDIEVINGEKLIFTEDTKCFPYHECEIVQKPRTDLTNITKTLIDNLKHSELDLGEWTPREFIPKPKIRKNFLSRFWDKILYTFTY
jgi:hypothetical protein